MKMKQGWSTIIIMSIKPTFSFFFFLRSNDFTDNMIGAKFIDVTVVP